MNTTICDKCKEYIYTFYQTNLPKSHIISLWDFTSKDFIKNYYNNNLLKSIINNLIIKNI